MYEKHSEEENVSCKQFENTVGVIACNEAVDSLERGMNPVAMTIINLEKEYMYLPSPGDRTSDLVFSSPVRYPLKCGGSATTKESSYLKTLWEKEQMLITIVETEETLREKKRLLVFSSVFSTHMDNFMPFHQI